MRYSSSAELDLRQDDAFLEFLHLRTCLCKQTITELSLSLSPVVCLCFLKSPHVVLWGLWEI